MDDQPIEDDKEQKTDYDTSDPELPIVLHPLPAGLDETHCHHKHSRVEHYVDVASKWTKNLFAFIWRDVLWNKGFWTFAATLVMAIATALYTHYARKQLKAINDQLPELQTSAAAAIGCR